MLPSPPKNNTPAATQEMRDDWQAYFGGTVPGTVTPWAQGTITLLPGGQFAMYVPADAKEGTRYLLDRLSIDNPNTLEVVVSMYSGVAAEWEHYGIVPNPEMQAYFQSQRGVA